MIRKNHYHGTYLNSLSGYVLSLSGRIQKYYYELSDKNYYHGTYLNSLSGNVLSLSGRIQK